VQWEQRDRSEDYSGRFKIHCDFAVIKEIATLNSDGEPFYHYEFLLPLQKNIQRLAPLIISDEESKRKYIQYLKDELLGYQNFNQLTTKELIISFWNMMIVVYRMPADGGACAAWVKPHVLKGVTKYVQCAEGLCFWVCATLWKNETDVDKTAVITSVKGL
jgi:hypothetical protein